MKIELTQGEKTLLVMLLEARQRELLHEISKTDAHEFRRGLQEKESMLEAMLRKLAATGVNAAA